MEVFQLAVVVVITTMHRPMKLAMPVVIMMPAVIPDDQGTVRSRRVNIKTPGNQASDHHGKNSGAQKLQ
jgi:hypothetical protein